MLRIYDGRETCVWSTEQRKHYVRRTLKHTNTIPLNMYMYRAGTHQPAANDRGHSRDIREKEKENERHWFPSTLV